MKIYFLRHADALDGADDDARPLSARGRREAEAIGGFLKHAGVSLDAVRSSPLVRAVQTAEIATSVCAARGVHLKTDDALRNETSLDDFEMWLKHLPEARHLLLVGHAPELGVRTAHMLGMRHAEALPLPKAGLVCVETPDRKRGRLVFFVSPEVLGRAAATP